MGQLLNNPISFTPCNITFRTLSASREQEPKELQSFEMEILDAVQPAQNSLIYLPHAASHALISAGVVQKHIFYLADNKDQEDVPQSCEKTELSHKETEESIIAKGKKGTSELEPHLKESVPTSPRKGNPAPMDGAKFYQQQKQKKKAQRRRGNTMNDQVDPEPVNVKLEYKKKNRRRTKSSNDSLKCLEKDTADLRLGENDDMTGKDSCDNPQKAHNVLVMVPTWRTVSETVNVLQAQLPHLSVMEHAGSSKSKIGLRKLLRTCDVVVSHVTAVRNCIKSRSFSLSELTLFVVIQIDMRQSESINDELIDLATGKRLEKCDLIMMFMHLISPSGLCAVEDVIRMFKAKLRTNLLTCVKENVKDLAKIIWPEVTYSTLLVSSESLVEVAEQIVQRMSTVYGTYGNIQGKVLSSIFTIL